MAQEIRVTVLMTPRDIPDREEMMQELLDAGDEEEDLPLPVAEMYEDDLLEIAQEFFAGVGDYECQTEIWAGSNTYAYLTDFKVLSCEIVKPDLHSTSPSSPLSATPLDAVSVVSATPSSLSPSDTSPPPFLFGDPSSPPPSVDLLVGDLSQLSPLVGVSGVEVTSDHLNSTLSLSHGLGFEMRHPSTGSGADLLTDAAAKLSKMSSEFDNHMILPSGQDKTAADCVQKFDNPFGLLDDADVFAMGSMSRMPNQSGMVSRRMSHLNPAPARNDSLCPPEPWEISDDFQTPKVLTDAVRTVRTGHFEATGDSEVEVSESSLDTLMENLLEGATNVQLVLDVTPGMVGHLISIVKESELHKHGLDVDTDGNIIVRVQDVGDVN